MATVPVRSFEDEWPLLAARLATFLSHKGVAACNVDDVVQETAVRLWSIRDRFDAGRPLWPLVVTIALNLLRDEARRSGREFCGAVPELSSEDDVERSALARVELRMVEESLAELTPQRRNALLAELGYQRTWGSHVRANKMVRMRARRALRELLEKKSVGWALALRVRKLSTTLQHLIGPRGLGAATDNIAAAAGAVAAIGLLALPSSGSGAAAASPVAPSFGIQAGWSQDAGSMQAVANGKAQDALGRGAGRRNAASDDSIPPGGPGHGKNQPMTLPIQPPDTSKILKVAINPPSIDPNEAKPPKVSAASSDEEPPLRRAVRQAATATGRVRDIAKAAFS